MKNRKNGERVDGMKLIADTNILITYFWKESVFQKMLEKARMQIITPDYAIKEIKEHQKEIIEKARLEKEEFDSMLKKLTEMIKVVPLNEYRQYVKKVKEIAAKFEDEEKREILNDADFLALSIKLGIAIWSNDKLLKRQEEIIVLNTAELIELLT